MLALLKEGAGITGSCKMLPDRGDGNRIQVKGSRFLNCCVNSPALFLFGMDSFLLYVLLSRGRAVAKATLDWPGHILEILISPSSETLEALDCAASASRLIY